MRLCGAEALCDGASVAGWYSFNGLVVERKVGPVTMGYDSTFTPSHN
jgi:uncharacterized membrane protein YbjE (DUF340 family)